MVPTLNYIVELFYIVTEINILAFMKIIWDDEHVFRVNATYDYDIDIEM